MTAVSRCFSMRAFTVLFTVLVWAFCAPVSADTGTGAPSARAASRSGATAGTPAGVFEFWIRDSRTGYGVAATIMLYPTHGAGIDRTAPIFLPSDTHGRGHYTLPAQYY